MNFKKTIFAILFFLPFVASAQFQTKQLNVGRSNIACDFTKDTILFVGGSDSDIVEYFNIKNGEVFRQEKYTTSDGFTGALVASNDKYAVYYNLYGVNLSDRNIYVNDKTKKKWFDRKDALVGGEYVSLIDGKVYSYSWKDSIHVYDILLNKNSKIPYPVKETDFSITHSEDKIFIVGGKLNDNNSKSMYEYDSKENKWTKHELLSGRQSPFVSYHENKIIIVGGFNDYSRKVEIYDLQSKTSKEIDIDQNYRDCIIVAKNDKVLLGAGDSNNMLTIDLKTEKVSPVKVLESTANFSGLRNLKAALIGSRVILAGDRFNRIHVYNFDSDTWEIVNITNQMYGANVFEYKNKAYVVGGGKYDKAEYTKDILIFDDLSSSTNNLNSSEEIVVFPNPSNGFFTWNTGNHKIIKFGLYDIQGKKLVEGSQNEVNISTYQNGIYNLVLESSNGIKFIKRVVVKN